MPAEQPFILYVITDLNVGGVPLHLHRLAKEVHGRGFRVSVVSLAPGGPVADRLAADGISVRSLAGRGGWDFRVIGRLARVLTQLRPDIVHAMLFHANLAARWAARRIGFPVNRVLCEIQTVEVERRWHLWLDRFTHKRCRYTIGNSPSVVEHLARHASIPLDRLRLVRGGIDPVAYRTATPIDRGALGLPAGARMILWVGRLDPVKGLDWLMESLASEQADVNAHLILAGDGPLRDQLAHCVAHMACRDRIHLLGARDDVPRLLKTTDVFVFPSRTEGLPNALLEAMAAGCPVVTTDAPGCRDLITHEETGLLVPYGDTSALADALGKLLDDRALASRLGLAAQSTASARWNIRETHARYGELYNEILLDHGP